MADSPTQRNRFRKQEVGAKTNAWGGDLNDDGGSDRIDESIDGVVAFALSGNKTLTSVNYETDEARQRIINVTGGTGGTVTVPALEKWYLVRNAASGTVVFSNGSNNVSVVSGEICNIFTNGTNFYKTNSKDYTDTAILNASISGDLPSQAGNAGKFIQTDGTNASWEDVEIADIFGLTTLLAGKQDLDSDLTAIAALTPSNDDVIQRKAGSWVNRSMSQLYTDLGGGGLTAALAGKQDLNANLTALASAGGIAQGIHTIPVLAGAMTPRTTNGPSPGLTESTTNKIMLKSLDYDPGTAEYAQITLPMPKSWNEGTVTVQFVWTASATGNVVWAAQAVSISDDDLIDSAFGTAQTVTDGVTATTDIMESAFTSAITIAGTPAAEDFVVFQFYRDAAAGGDTCSADARLLAVRIKYTINAQDDA